MAATSTQSFRLLIVLLAGSAVVLNYALDLSYAASIVSKLFIFIGVVLVVFNQQFSEISSQGGNFTGLPGSLPNLFEKSREPGLAFKFLGSLFFVLSILIAIMGNGVR